MLTLYSFSDFNCVQEGNIYENIDKTIRVVYNDGAYKMAEQIIPLYEKYGNRCIQLLHGALSFCLYDKKKKQLLVMRDKMGEKQLYYAQLPTGIVFADSLKDVLQYIKRPQIREHELAQPIRHNFPIELQHTWIEQIKRVRAGEYAVVDEDGLRLYTYWKRNHTVTFQGTKEDAIAETQRLLRASVQRCMQTDGPVAVLLSGGIDSTTLALFAKECQKEVHVISAGYKGQHACDERQVAKRFAQEYGLIYHEVELDVNDFQNLFDEYIQYIDEPCFDVSSMSQFALYKKAAEMGFKVILSGLGGDELFYSYRPENALVSSLKLKREYNACFPLKKNMIKYLNFIVRNWKYIFKANYPIMDDDKMPVLWTYKDYMKFKDSAFISHECGSFSFKDVDVQYTYPYTYGLNEVYDFQMSTFTNQLCVYLGNKLCAANMIEMRYPFLDYKLIEFLDSLPLNIKFDYKFPKFFQKEVMKGILPDYILYARKRGFEPPFDFIWKMCKKYEYRILKSDYVFFNSMMADKLLIQHLKK